jgi:hypothetical protein
VRNITRDLTDLLLRLNRLIDCDFDDDVTPEEIDEHLEMGDVLYWLETKFWGHFKMAKSYRNTCGAIALVFKAIRQAAKARQSLPHRAERERVGAWLRSPSSRTANTVLAKPFDWEPEHNGICVLISCVGQAIQRRAPEQGFEWRSALS